MAQTQLDPVRTAVLVADMCEEIQRLEALAVTSKAQMDIFREMLRVSQEQVRLLRVCLQVKDTTKIADTIEAALMDVTVEEVGS